MSSKPMPDSKSRKALMYFLLLTTAQVNICVPINFWCGRSCCKLRTCYVLQAREGAFEENKLVKYGKIIVSDRTYYRVCLNNELKKSTLTFPFTNTCVQILNFCHKLKGLNIIRGKSESGNVVRYTG